ncbi:unnamed protein product, partial [Brenthis ino]
MSRRKQAKPRSLKPEDEEEWVEGDRSEGIEDTNVNNSSSDNEETHEETMEDKHEIAEENIEEKEDGDDTASLKKSIDQFEPEDVAGCAAAMAASRRVSPPVALLYDHVPAYLQPFAINLHQTPWTSNIYMLIRSQF